MVTVSGRTGNIFTEFRISKNRGVQIFRDKFEIFSEIRLTAGRQETPCIIKEERCG